MSDWLKGLESKTNKQRIGKSEMIQIQWHVCQLAHLNTCSQLTVTVSPVSLWLCGSSSETVCNQQILAFWPSFRFQMRFTCVWLKLNKKNKALPCPAYIWYWLLHATLQRNKATDSPCVHGPLASGTLNWQEKKFQQPPDSCIRTTTWSLNSPQMKFDRFDRFDR